MDTSHIIVAGTGRAGTSFLMALLTELGYDTGFDTWIRGWDHKVRAGEEWGYPWAFKINKLYELEWNWPKTNTNMAATTFIPRVVKSPRFAFQLHKLLEKNQIKVDYAIVPFRKVKHVAASYLKAGLEWESPGREQFFKKMPPQRRKELFWYIQLGYMLETFVEYEIPHVFIRFPKMVEDGEYLFNKLILPFPDLDRDKFFTVYNKLADINLVNEGRS